eukprot:scaffold650098_cov41-Prasinocladus_malaysianus.AAC.1
MWCWAHRSATPTPPGCSPTRSRPRPEVTTPRETSSTPPPCSSGTLPRGGRTASRTPPASCA